MNIDDEILAKIMKDCSSSYIDDAGFAKSVVGKLPRRRMSPATRRLLLVSGAALASTTLAVVLYAPALADLASSALEYVEAGSGGVVRALGEVVPRGGGPRPSHARLPRQVTG
jgi:hypothetical protein